MGACLWEWLGQVLDLMGMREHRLGKVVNGGIEKNRWHHVLMFEDLFLLEITTKGFLKPTLLRKIQHSLSRVVVGHGLQ